MAFHIIEILILIIVLYLFATVIKIDGRIKGMKYSLDQISKGIDIPENPIDPEIKRLINEGNDVKAIKRSRELFGLTLLEGKQYVDDLKVDNK